MNTEDTQGQQSTPASDHDDDDPPFDTHDRKEFPVMLATGDTSSLDPNADAFLPVQSKQARKNKRRKEKRKAQRQASMCDTVTNLLSPTAPSSSSQDSQSSSQESASTSNEQVPTKPPPATTPDAKPTATLATPTKPQATKTHQEPRIYV